MTRLLYRMWWTSFWPELRVFVFPAGNLAIRATPTALAAIGAIFGFAIGPSLLVTIRGQRLVEISLVHIVTGIFVTAVLLSGIGYAAARARYGRLVLANELELNSRESLVGVRVSYAGRGEVEPMICLREAALQRRVALQRQVDGCNAGSGTRQLCHLSADSAYHYRPVSMPANRSG